MVPVITVRILLKSWAIPPVSWPTASIFSACRIRSSAAILSVRSRKKMLNRKPSRRFSAVTLISARNSLAVTPASPDLAPASQDLVSARIEETLQGRTKIGTFVFGNDELCRNFVRVRLAATSRILFPPGDSSRR